ncbi:hypothetical protein [Terriglobus roseus]|uniref:Uncharacterized protein n=1 Tax=Terriglobus roseus TaxID=392734 RepID=A0A1H4J4A9_9BACT|nr:hypothetical protein [Terriglobus roseus]SEB40382.1 hypothetical protein SAMN05443244_0305 [Terriglobus roseus]
MHRVHMRFLRQSEDWLIRFTDLTGKEQLRDLTFRDPDKIEHMVERAGGLRDLAGKQALEMGIRTGVGGIELKLNEEQYRKLKR